MLAPLVAQSLVRFIRSVPPIRAITEVFLIRLTIWLTRGGRMILTVWGRMTQRMVWT